MAAVTEVQHTNMETDNRRSGELSEVLQRLDKLEGGLIDRFNGLLKPIMEKLDDLTWSLQKISQTADEAHSMALQHSNRIAKLQEQGDKAFEQTVILSNKIRFLNLKLRRETGSRLKDLSYDLAYKGAGYCDDFSLFLTQTYRIGWVNNPLNLFPEMLLLLLQMNIWKTMFLTLPEKKEASCIIRI